MVQHDSVGAAVSVVQSAGEGHSGLEVLQAEDADLVVRLHLVVVCLVVECEGQHALLLQVGLVDPRDDKIEFCLMHSWATNAYFQPQGCSPSK